MVTEAIAQGDVFWADLGLPFGSEPGGHRPVLVVQSDVFNRTRLDTVVVAALTTNQRLGSMPGNVRLRKGEAGLPRDCTVNVTQLATLDRKRLIEKVGALASDRLRSVLDGLDLLLHGVR